MKYFDPIAPPKASHSEDTNLDQKYVNTVSIPVLLCDRLNLRKSNLQESINCIATYLRFDTLCSEGKV